MLSFFAPLDRKEFMDPLYLLGFGALLMFVFGYRHQTKMMRSVAKRIPGKAYLPRALHVAIIATQLYELVLVVEHASLVTLAAGVMLLAIVTATKSGTEGRVANFHSDDKSG